VAGEWLKFESNLPDKPETLAITAAMGWDDPDLTVGKLMRVFRWFDQHTVDGNARGVTVALLDRVIGVSGFVQAMSDVHWLVVDKDGLRLQNFDRHNGATAKSRAQTAKRVANHRSNAGGNADSNGATVTPALAREEKRREEKKTPPTPKGEGRFPEFWDSWPNTDRKADRKKCVAKWSRSGWDSEADSILAHVTSMKATRKWLDGFEPAPLTYLNGERWRDGVAASAAADSDIFAGAR